MPDDISKHPDFQKLCPASYEVVEHASLRKLMAERLKTAKQVVPHFYVEVDCKASALLETRLRFNAPKTGSEQTPASRVTINDLLVKTVGMALADVPEVNVSWSQDWLVRYKRADVGVAVAVDGGVMVPHIENVPDKDVWQISNEMRGLIDRAQQFRLLPREYSGRATTMSNLGMYGVKSFAAIINPPNSTMLAFGGVRPDTLCDGGTLLTLTASVDHRAVDGVAAARFVGAIRDRLENADFG